MVDGKVQVEPKTALAALDRIIAVWTFLWSHDEAWGRKFIEDCDIVDTALKQYRDTKLVTDIGADTPDSME